MLNEINYLILNNEIKTQKLFSSAELLNKIFFELKEKSLDPTLSGSSDFII
jgi:hypothetical protein